MRKIGDVSFCKFILGNKKGIKWLTVLVVVLLVIGAVVEELESNGGIYVHTCIYTIMHIYICIYVYIRTYIYYVFVYVCYICIYILYIFIYIYINVYISRNF